MKIRCVCILSRPFNGFVFVRNFQLFAKIKHSRVQSKQRKYDICKSCTGSRWRICKNIPKNSTPCLNLAHTVKRCPKRLYAKMKSGKSFQLHLFTVQSLRGMLSAWTLWNFYHWFYFILLPILSPFWQHVLSPPLVKSSKRIKSFIPPQQKTFYPES